MVQHQSRKQGARSTRIQLGQGRVWQVRAVVQRPEPPGFRAALLRNCQHQPGWKERSCDRIFAPGKRRRHGHERPPGRRQGSGQEVRRCEGPARGNAVLHPGHRDEEGEEGGRRGRFRGRRGRGAQCRQPVLQHAHREGRDWRDCGRHLHYVRRHPAPHAQVCGPCSR